MAISVKNEFCVYIGPSVRGAFNSGTVFLTKRADVLKKYDALFQKYPHLKPLVVPSDKLAQALHEIKTPGTALHRIWEKAAKSGKEGD